jgi:predicted RNase H-like nuclease (RuvC/YqgF family)
VSAFCDANNIEDKDDFIYLCFKQGFDIKKFGLLGETLNEGEKHLKTGGVGEKRVEIEVIREIRVEVPVEKIVERIVNVTDDTKINELLLKIQQLENRPPEIVEVVKEVPVDRVVEKIIYTTDNIQINELGGKIAELEQEISTKTTEMENIFQNRMSKKDEELDELRQKLDDPVTNNKLNMLQDTLQNLRNDLSLKNDKINELEKINQELQKTANLQNAIYMKGSNLNSRI